MVERTQSEMAEWQAVAELEDRENRPDINGIQFLDDVIKTRVPQLYSSPFGGRFLPLVYRLINHRHTAQLMHEWSRCPSGIEVIREIHRTMRLQVTTCGIDNVPASGGCLLVSNHPTGLMDGIALFDPISRFRQDVAAFSFHDILSINPQASDAFIPVEWRPSHQSTAKSRKTFRIAHKAFKSGRLVTIFPSGRLSFWNGLRIAERPWKDSFIALARRYNLPIVPAHIGSRNSLLYYGVSAISSTLRDLQSINEIRNKADHRYSITFGKPVMPRELNGSSPTLAQCFQHYVEHVLPHQPGADFSSWRDPARGGRGRRIGSPTPTAFLSAVE